MFEFPSENSVRSLKSSVSQSSSSSSSPSSSSSSSAEWFKPQVPMPDMVSAPTTFTSNLQTVDEAKENVIRIFLRILTKAHKSPESSFEQEDAASSALIIVRTLASLGLEDIKDLYTKIESRVPAEIRAHHHHAFLDLVSMTATNPCMAFLIEHVKAGRMSSQEGTWIVANAIRNIKTPTVQLMNEPITTPSWTSSP